MYRGIAVLLACACLAAPVYSQDITRAYVVPSQNGEFYIKVIVEKGKARAVAYRVTTRKRDKLLWKIDGLTPGRLELSNDGIMLRQHHRGEDILYRNGERVTPAKQMEPQTITQPTPAKPVEPEPQSIKRPMPPPVTGPPPRKVPEPAAPSEEVGAPPVIFSDFQVTCEIAATLNSGRRQAIIQQGPSREVAIDRAMALCEGMLGIGSRRPMGTCVVVSCR